MWGGKWCFFFFQAEDGIRDFCLSRGLGEVYKRQPYTLLIPGASPGPDRVQARPGAGPGPYPGRGPGPGHETIR